MNPFAALVTAQRFCTLHVQSLCVSEGHGSGARGDVCPAQHQSCRLQCCPNRAGSVWMSEAAPRCSEGRLRASPSTKKAATQLGQQLHIRRVNEDRRSRIIRQQRTLRCTRSGLASRRHSIARKRAGSDRRWRVFIHPWHVPDGGRVAAQPWIASQFAAASLGIAGNHTNSGEVPRPRAIV
jgi:hypothetical protein